MSELVPEQRHLRRLETLIDSIYALVIVILVSQVPNPLDAEGAYDSVAHFFSVNGPRQIEQQSSSTDDRRLSSGLPPSVDEVADDDDARSRLEAV